MNKLHFRYNFFKYYYIWIYIFQNLQKKNQWSKILEMGSNMNRVVLPVKVKRSSLPPLIQTKCVQLKCFKFKKPCQVVCIPA